MDSSRSLEGHACFGILAIGDVEARADDAGEVAGFVTQRNLGGEDDAVLAARLVEREFLAIDERHAGLDQRLFVREKLFGMLARKEIEVGLANEVGRLDTHAIRDEFVGGSEAALRVLRVDEGGNQVDHRPQYVALVRERIREIAALGAGAVVLRKAVHGSRGNGPGALICSSKGGIEQWLTDEPIA